MKSRSLGPPTDMARIEVIMACTESSHSSLSLKGAFSGGLNVSTDMSLNGSTEPSQLCVSTLLACVLDAPSNKASACLGCSVVTAAVLFCGAASVDSGTDAARVVGGAVCSVVDGVTVGAGEGGGVAVGAGEGGDVVGAGEGGRVAGAGVGDALGVAVGTGLGAVVLIAVSTAATTPSLLLPPFSSFEGSAVCNFKVDTFGLDFVRLGGVVRFVSVAEFLVAVSSSTSRLPAETSFISTARSCFAGLADVTPRS